MDARPSHLSIRPVDYLINTIPLNRPADCAAGCFRVVCAAPSRSGKSFIIAALLRRLKDLRRIDNVFVFSGTAGLNDDYKAIADGVERFSEDALTALMEQCEELKMRGTYRHTVILFDDILELGAKARTCEPLIRLISAGRHANLSAVLCSQVAKYVVTPTIKVNASHILFTRVPADSLGSLSTGIMFNPPGLPHTATATEVSRAFVRFACALPQYTFGVCVQPSGELFQVKAEPRGPPPPPQLPLTPLEEAEAVSEGLNSEVVAAQQQIAEAQKRLGVLKLQQMAQDSLVDAMRAEAKKLKPAVRSWDGKTDGSVAELKRWAVTQAEVLSADAVVVTGGRAESHPASRLAGDFDVEMKPSAAASAAPSAASSRAQRIVVPHYAPDDEFSSLPAWVRENIVCCTCC